MARKAAHQMPEIRDAIFRALRAGKTRAETADEIGAPLVTFLGWIDRDEVFQRGVELAESQATSTGTAMRHEASKKKGGEDRWDKIKREAEVLAPGIFGFILWVEGVLVAKGNPPIPPWWKSELRRFYASGKRWFVARVGRGAGKSHWMAYIATVEAIFGGHVYTNGTIPVWPVMSTDKGEARGRLTMIKATLDALGIEYTETEKDSRPRIIAVDMLGQTIEWRVYPATVAGASGFTALGATCDEEAKWKDEDSGANPADEVLKALRPTFRARPGLHGYRVSSAWIESGSHYESIDDGQTDLNYVATIGEEFIEQVKDMFELVASREKDHYKAKIIRDYYGKLTAESPNIPTFLANPTIDAINTRIDEPDLMSWLREYGSRPMGSIAAGFFDAGSVEVAKRLPKLRGVGTRYAAIDTGSKKNACALAIVERIDRKVKLPSGKVAIVSAFKPVLLREWVPMPGKPLDIDRIVLPEMAALTRRQYVREWTSDAYYGTSVELRGQEEGINTVYTGPDPFEESYEPARRALYREEVHLSGCEGVDELCRQLKKVQSQPLDGGKTKIIIPIEKKKEGEELHGDLGVAFIRALAKAGAGAVYDVGESASDISSVPGRYNGEVNEDGRDE